jgi:excisionase family DNA binding protein
MGRKIVTKPRPRRVRAGVTPALLDPVEAAAYLSLSPHTVRAWAQAGKLPSVKLGTTLRFSRRALDAWIVQHEREAS